MKKPQTVIFTTFFLILISMNFLLLGLKQINESNHPSFEDTGTYLEGALLIEENGGLGNFINLCINGKYKVAEQHPLYLIILSTIASRDLSFFQKSQLITLSVGLIVIVCLFFISRMFFDGIVPFLATFLLSVNGSFLLRSSNVAVETVLILLFLISWYFMVRGVDKERYWLFSGLVGGFAYMTKVTGLFLVPIFIIATLFTRGIKVLKRREFYLFFLMFLIPCLPWIIRNIIVYGKPVYEGINSYTLWLDSYEEISRPKYNLIANWKELNYTWSNLPTMGTYINTHSLYEIAKRGLYGVKGELVLVFKSMNIFFNPTGGYIVGITLSIIAFFGMLKDKNRNRVFYTATMFSIFFVSFSWGYQVIPHDRFITPLLPIFCLYAAFGIQEISKLVDSKLVTHDSRFRYASWIPYTLAVMLVLMVGYQVFKQRGLPAIPTLKLTEDQQELFSWLKDNVTEDDTVLMGPTNHYWGYLWHVGFKGKLLPTAGNDPMIVNEGLAEFNEFLRQRKASIIILHKENYRFPKVLADYFEFDASSGLKEKKPIDGWELVYRQSQVPNRFLVYRIRHNNNQLNKKTP